MQWDATAGRGFTSGLPWTPFATDSANVAAQDAGSMLETYRALIKRRKTSDALTRGDFTMVKASDPAILAFARRHPNEKLLVLVNFSSSAVTATTNLEAAGITAAAVTEYLFGTALAPVEASNASAYPVAVPALWLQLK